MGSKLISIINIILVIIFTTFGSFGVIALGQFAMTCNLTAAVFFIVLCMIIEPLLLFGCINVITLEVLNIFHDNKSNNNN